ncbi:uncharacterized protein LOC118480173 [Helianthus annuus]|uniref:uncharacterized protein LOC118480173 n=1 Tax=Helianthus annuus TaxID=4232 RepID=UPI001652C63E|nr:uncharacterized protein LOC118480173 [Helianthus annuus]
MFYSQFILAKKGPLGVIWIAVHLERKLRKNQVADTDIGVSVESIQEEVESEEEQLASEIVDEVIEEVVTAVANELKDLQVFTFIRVIFQLCEEIPCISAIVVALLFEPEPKIDYTLKAVGGSLAAIHGLFDMIDVYLMCSGYTVKTIVKDMLEWPHRMVVPILPTDTSDLELKPHGQLTLTIVKANNLKNVERTHISYEMGGRHMQSLMNHGPILPKFSILDKLEKLKERQAAKEKKEVKCENVAQEEKSEQSDEDKVVEKIMMMKTDVEDDVDDGNDDIDGDGVTKLLLMMKDGGDRGDHPTAAVALSTVNNSNTFIIGHRNYSSELGPERVNVLAGIHRREGVF